MCHVLQAVKSARCDQGVMLHLCDGNESHFAPQTDGELRPISISKKNKNTVQSQLKLQTTAQLINSVFGQTPSAD